MKVLITQVTIKRKKKSEVRTVQYNVLGNNYVAVPNVPIADKHLGTYKVSLEELERHVDVVFHPDLDRVNVGDLCLDSGCNLQDYKEFMQFFWSRRLKSPWNLQNLEKDWAEILSKGAANEELEKIYNESKVMLFE